jgi:hypothetical protein
MVSSLLQSDLNEKPEEKLSITDVIENAFYLLSVQDKTPVSEQDLIIELERINHSGTPTGDLLEKLFSAKDTNNELKKVINQLVKEKRLEAVNVTVSGQEAVAYQLNPDRRTQIVKKSKATF